MINTINGTNIPKNNIFGTVTNRNCVADYWLEKNTGQNDVKPANSTLGSILPETIILNPEEARKTKNLKIIGWSIASATIIAAGGIFFVLRGGPKGLAKGFQSLRDYLERKVEKSKLSGAKASRYEYLLGKTDYFLEKAQAINNFTTIKDLAFKKLMFGRNLNWKHSGKIHIGITNMYERLGLKTIAKSYSKTMLKFEQLKESNLEIIAKLEKSGDLTKKITVNGITLPKHEWITLLRDKSIETENLFRENFSKKARKSRYLRIKRFTKELEKNFEEKGALWFLSKDTLKTFVAETAMLPKKLRIQHEINGIKQTITYTPKDLYSDAETKIMKISSALNAGDKAALEKLNKVRKNFKQFSKKGELDRNVMLSDLSTLESEIEKTAKTKSDDKELISMIKELRNLYTTYKKGNMEDILEIYKVLLPKEKYEKVAQEFSKGVKSLKKSIKLETEDFINKSRDLSMGSAPTDILTVLGGIGTLAYYLGKSDNAQERTAITLKYGIPALVGIGVSLYGNARLFAGSKSLIFATASSFIANRIGSFTNNLYEKHLKKTGTYIEPEN